MELNMVECPVCGSSIQIGQDAVVGELMACPECGTELEITSIKPPAVSEAPQEEEDWGE
jgi:alpha-aminoadipate carrier protein LysW